MAKATILNVDQLRLLADVPRDSPLVIDFADEDFRREVLAEVEHGRRSVSLLIVKAGSLADPRIGDFVGHGVQLLVRPAAAPSIAEALRAARSLAVPEIQVELPLETQDHLDVLKVLSSLGVRVRIPVQALCAQPELAGEALADAVVRPGRRAPVTPFSDLERGFMDEQLELAQLDLRGNDHYVDLRGLSELPPASAWKSVDVAAKRVPFLLERHACAFCEGLCFCNGYLFAPESFDGCRALFSDFIELYDRAFAASQKDGCSCGQAREPRRPRSGGRAC